MQASDYDRIITFAAIEMNKYDSTNDKKAFLATLPTSFPLCGYLVTVSRFDRGISVAVSDEPTEDRMMDGSGFCIEATKKEVLDFLNFYLHTPTAMHLLQFKDVAHKRHALFALNLYLSDWRFLNMPRDSNGKLPFAVNCIAVVSERSQYGAGRCSRRTKNASGLCPQHAASNPRTIWTHYFPS